MPTRSLAIATCLAFAAAAAAQGSSSNSSSSSHRVVVIDGKKVVDEKVVDGKPADGVRDGAPALPPEMQDMLDRVRRGLPVGVPDGAGGSQSSSHTHRVVVENGKVVVDEETRDGRPVRGGGGGGGAGPAHADAHAEAHAEAHGESHGDSSKSSGADSRADGSRGSSSSDKGEGAGKGRAGGAGRRAPPPPVDLKPAQPAPVKPAHRRVI